MSFKEKMIELRMKKIREQREKNKIYFNRFYSQKIKVGDNILWRGEKVEVTTIDPCSHCVFFGDNAPRMHIKDVLKILI